MKVKLVKLASGSSFLVINNTSGKPVYSYDGQPIFHPDGYVYFPLKEYGYDESKEMTGKLYKLVDTTVEIEAVPECIPAKEKFSEYEQLKTECDRLQYGRYAQHPSIVEKADS